MVSRERFLEILYLSIEIGSLFAATDASIYNADPGALCRSSSNAEEGVYFRRGRHSILASEISCTPPLVFMTHR